MNKLLNIVVLVAILTPLPLACGKKEVQSQPFEQSVAYPMLKPGEKIDGMLITTDMEGAIPLWSFCSSTREIDHRIVVNCNELSFDKLAIGHPFGVVDLIPQSVAWEELTWQMAVDGHLIDLEAFGTYDFVHPDLALNPSPIREVFRTVKVWNVVLVNPTLGKHTLEGQTWLGEQTYTWVVNFTVATTN